MMQCEWSTHKYIEDMITLLPTIYEHVASKIGKAQKYNKMYCDKTVKGGDKWELKAMGDKAMIKNYEWQGPWTANWKGPYFVVDLFGKTVVKLRTKDKNPDSKGRKMRTPGILDKLYRIDQLKKASTDANKE